MCAGFFYILAALFTNTKIMHTKGMLRDDALKGKTIIVTGGGTGLGRSMGKYFLELGANLVICSRKIKVLEKTAAIKRIMEKRRANGASRQINRRAKKSEPTSQASIKAATMIRTNAQKRDANRPATTVSRKQK